MELASILKVENVVLNLAGEDAQAAIVNLVGHLVSENKVAEAKKELIIQALFAREDQVSTGIGSGVAIPHVFSTEVDEVIAVFGRSKEGIDFEAIDNAPVHFVLLLLVPEKDRSKHLQTLAAIAKMFKACGTREALEAAASPSDVIAVLEDCLT